MSSGKVYKSIEPLDEEELEKDIRFALQTKWETDDHLVDELIPIIRYHQNEAMAKFQEKMLEDITQYFKGELAGVIMRSRRETGVVVSDVKHDW